MCVFHKSHAVYMNSVKILRKKGEISEDACPTVHQSVGRRSNVGTARVKSHVIRVQNASKLGEKA